MSDYIPIEQMAELDEVKLSSLKTLRYKNTKGNDIRFKNIDGKIYIHQDYKAMYRREVEDLYYKAIIVAGNENKLATDLSKMLNKKKDTVQRYFIRFTFKQVEVASEIAAALKTYITQNSLFQMGLHYE